MMKPMKPSKSNAAVSRKPSKRNAAVSMEPSKSNVNAKLKPINLNAKLKPIVSMMLQCFDFELRSGGGETFYRSVLRCKNRGTSLCQNCKDVAGLLKSHARISTHSYCTVPRCGEVKVHRMKEEDLVTGLRDEMQRMSITGDVVKPEAVKVHRVKEEDDLTGLREEMQLMTITGDVTD